MAAIAVRRLHKCFRIPHERRTTLAERALGLFRPVPYERLEALCGVDLEVEPGSFVGIIGSNGSGKSTLLKVIAGLLVPDAGEVKVEGSVSALLELGLGFSPELTVRENVELYGAILGFPRRQTGARVEAAIRFAELERFRDAKLKNLSTGMQMRLAFATALQAASDILLLDEVLAVGDASFQCRCLDVFSDLKARRKTVVLVSHDLAQVQRFCDHAVLLEAGQVAASGSPGEVVQRYLAGGPAAAEGGGAQRDAIGSGRVRLREGWLEDEAGERVTSICSGQRPTVVLVADVAADTTDPVFGVMIRDGKGSYVYAINTLWLGFRIGQVRAGQPLEIRMPFFAALRNGPYAVDSAVADQSGAVIYDWVHAVTSFSVTGSLCLNGMADLRAQFSWRPLPGGRGPEPLGDGAAGGGGLR